MPGKDCPQMDLLVTIEDIEASPAPTARKLGVVLDDQLCCNANIASVAQALVITRLDYCNCLSLFRDLHWLAVIARIIFKTLVLAYKAVSRTTPTNLRTLVRPHDPAPLNHFG